MIDVHVRFFALDRVVVDDSLLSDDERERVARKATAALRQRQAASFQCVRVTLAEVLDTKPRELAFEIHATGKPALVGGGLHFNVSHSGGVGMLAWGARKLGADVQSLIVRSGDALARKVLSPREWATWRGLPASEQSAWLTRAWTRKESALKAAGCGLRTAPSAVEVMGDADGPNARGAQTSPEAWSVTLDGRRWAGVDWQDGVPVGFTAAICVEAEADEAPHG